MDLGAHLPARGRLLVARPGLLDPNFARTVILLCEHHDDEGTLGFVLNRPTPRRLTDILSGEHEFPGRRDPVWWGGPVGLDGMSLLHRLPRVRGASEVAPGVFVGGAVQELGPRVRKSATPEDELRFVVGYAGWGRGQLDREMKEDSWVVLPASREIVFDADSETLWRRLLRDSGNLREGPPPGVDPNLN
jgi:putative transcriptional regulator